jgi:hypothetical protein
MPNAMACPSEWPHLALHANWSCARGTSFETPPKERAAPQDERIWLFSKEDFRSP